ncbi:MAG TPA: 16S rRNA (cytosine(1402)-N(4))-methyltransferase RsmH [Candidatus Paceibacterota bacterium]
MTHIPVLLKESLEILNIEEGDIYLDATLGNGGHSEEVWKRFPKKVTLAGIDADSDAVEVAKTRLELLEARPKLAVLNFRNIDKVTEILEIGNPDKILFDLGWNRSQFEAPAGGVGRGFSFQKDEPLLMTFSTDSKGAPFTAETIVNEWQEENLATVIESYGEEKFARHIAKTIVEKRTVGKIKTTGELVQIIKQATPTWYHFRRIHPATRTFQALRIAVNDELRALEEGLSKAFEILKPGGRIAVISFHSLEDRIVKRLWKELREKEGANILNKRPIIASEEEIKENPRARSAKLRAIEKI